VQHWGGIEMEETYRQYVIRSGASPMLTCDEWKPIAQVNWDENRQQRVKQWNFYRGFPTYIAAENAGHRIAKKWIDSQVEGEE